MGSSNRLGPVARPFDLPAPLPSLKLQIDSRQCGDEIDGRGTRPRPEAGARQTGANRSLDDQLVEAWRTKVATAQMRQSIRLVFRTWNEIGTPIGNSLAVDGRGVHAMAENAG